MPINYWIFGLRTNSHYEDEDFKQYQFPKKEYSSYGIKEGDKVLFYRFGKGFQYYYGCGTIGNIEEDEKNFLAYYSETKAFTNTANPQQFPASKNIYKIFQSQQGIMRIDEEQYNMVINAAGGLHDNLDQAIFIKKEIKQIYEKIKDITNPTWEWYAENHQEDDLMEIAKIEGLPLAEFKKIMRKVYKEYAKK